MVEAGGALPDIKEVRTLRDVRRFLEGLLQHAQVALHICGGRREPWSFGPAMNTMWVWCASAPPRAPVAPPLPAAGSGTGNAPHVSPIGGPAVGNEIAGGVSGCPSNASSAPARVSPEDAEEFHFRRGRSQQWRNRALALQETRGRGVERISTRWGAAWRSPAATAGSTSCWKNTSAWPYPPKDRVAPLIAPTVKLEDRVERSGHAFVRASAYTSAMRISSSAAVSFADSVVHAACSGSIAASPTSATPWGRRSASASSGAQRGHHCPEHLVVEQPGEQGRVALGPGSLEERLPGAVARQMAQELDVVLVVRSPRPLGVPHVAGSRDRRP